MRYLLLLMVAPELAFAGTLAAHSNDFKALEILEASQPPAAPKPALKPRPRPAPAPKPAPPEPSAEAKALDALMNSSPAAAPAPAPKTVEAPAPRKTVVAAPHPIRVIARAKPKPKLKVRVARAALRAPAAPAAREPEPRPVAKSRYVNFSRTVAKAAPARPAQRFSVSAPPRSNAVPAAIEFKKPQETEEIDAQEPVATEGPGAGTEPAIAAATPSADSEALDALIESAPSQPARAVIAKPMAEPEEDRFVEVHEVRQVRAARSRRYLNDNSYRRELDPNEIRKIQPKRIQSVWY